MLPLRRITPYLNLLHARSLATCPDEPSTADALSLAKIISTLFLLSPHRLTSLPYVITPSSALISLRRISDPNSSLRLFRLLSDLHVSLSPSSYRHVICKLSSYNLFVDALNLFDEMTHANSNSFDPLFLDFLLNTCINAGNLDTSLHFLTRATQFRCRIRTYTFNKLLSLLIRVNRAQDAIFLFREHSRSQLVFAADTCSYNEIIKCCCKLRDFEGAFSFFREMSKFGCCPDTVTYNVLIDGLCKAKEVDRGQEVLRGIQLDGHCVPNVVTYTSIVSGYCRLGKMEEAKRIFDEMIEVGIKPSRVTYNVLINGYGKVGDLSLAFSIYDMMKVCGCAPDIVTYTSLIDGYCRSGKLNGAMKLWDEMGGKHIRPNVYTFDIVIKSLCKMNRLSEACTLLKELNGRTDIVARAFVYNPVIDGLCKAGDVDEANSIMGEMEMTGCRPDKFTYTILIIGHCMKGRMSEAIDLFNRMVVTGCAPDSITVFCFVSCLLKAGMPTEAKRIMVKSSGKDLKLDGFSLEDIPPLLTKRTDVSVAV